MGFVVLSPWEISRLRGIPHGGVIQQLIWLSIYTHTCREINDVHNNDDLDHDSDGDEESNDDACDGEC